MLKDLKLLLTLFRWSHSDTTDHYFLNVRLILSEASSICEAPRETAYEIAKVLTWFCTVQEIVLVDL